MRAVNANGVTLHVQEEGDPNGAPVLLANSLGTDLRLWDAIIPLLPDGLRPIRYDKRGHDLSDCPGGPYAMDDLSTDAEGLIEGLGLGPVTFIGLPTLAIAGRHDGASPPDLVAATAAPIPDAQFHVIVGAGHLPCVENPAAYAAILNPFPMEHAYDQSL